MCKIEREREGRLRDTDVGMKECTRSRQDRDDALEIYNDLLIGLSCPGENPTSRLDWPRVIIYYADASPSGKSDLLNTGSVSKNLMLYENACQAKPTFGKLSSLLMLQWLQSLDQNKVKNGSILKWTIYEF